MLITIIVCIDRLPRTSPGITKELGRSRLFSEVQGQCSVSLSCQVEVGEDLDPWELGEDLVLLWHCHTAGCPRG